MTDRLELPDDWWPSVLRRFAEEDLWKENMVTVARTYTPPDGTDHDYVISNTALVPQSKWPRISKSLVNFDHKVRNSGPQPIIPDNVEQEPYVPKSWIGFGQQERFEPLVFSWESHNRTVFQPLTALGETVDGPGLLTGSDIGARYTDTRGHGPTGTPLCVMRPTSTDQVSAILKLCNEAGRPVVPQGGMTGLVGGGAPGEGDVVLSLERMNAVSEIDEHGRTMTAEAGVVLEVAQQVADDAGFMMPVDLGARGSATIGGLISTNAGGNRVIRYGMTRQSVLGLEAVLADGTVLTSMNRMLKNNAGYDLKQLFIGSEGTLGIVTRCVLRLQPKPRTTSMAFVGIDSFDNVPKFLSLLDSSLGGALGAFEVMWSGYYDFVTEYCPSLKPPLPLDHRFYVLAESLGSDPEGDDGRFGALLETAHGQGLIQGGVVAQSESDREDLWAIREGAGEGFRVIAPMFTYDVSMPILTMDDFGTRAINEIEAVFPGAKTLVLGHLGDGNLHAVIAVGDGSADAHRKVNDILYGIIRDLGGSVSAEHGIGTEKRDYLSWSRTEAEVDLMRTLKRTLDPKGILNPEKVI